MKKFENKLDKKKESKNIDYEQKFINNDNVTKYGEFVCSTFAWLPIDKQKEKANEFEQITKEEKSKK